MVKNYVIKTRQLLGFGLFAIFLLGCYPQGAEYIDELDLVVTVQDDDTNYSQFQTYFIPDTIAYVSGDEDDELDEAAQLRIISKIVENMNAYGWERLTEEEAEANGTDVVVLGTVIDNLNVAIGGGWWDWWGWWPGWGWYPPFPPGGWYPGYPGYCCYNQIYAWREGTLIVEMVDPNNGIDEGDNDPDPLPLLWMGGLNGLLEGSQSSIEARTDRGIDQMFVDSPYLDKN